MKIYIKKNNELSSTFNQFLNIQENSADYRRFVAEEYQQQSYTVWEYSKDRDFSTNNQLNLILKKKSIIILVQCKNDNANIGMDEINSFKAQSKQFIQENKIFENYNIKLRYAMSGLFLKEDAYRYIQNHPDEIDYNIIKMKS
jgi:hypothetical protein